MTFKTDLTALLAPHFIDGDVFHTTAPDGYVETSSHVFAITQGVGGDEEMYVDQEIPDTIHRRVQFWFWGRDLLEVEAKHELIYGVLLNTINDPLSNFIGVEPMGGPTDDYNDVLKLYGSRQDFGIRWKRP